MRFEWLATGRGPLAWEADPDDIPALDAELVHDPLERRLLQAFRCGGRETRRLLLGLADAQLASIQPRAPEHRAGRRRHARTCAQNDPNIVPSTITTTSATIEPSTAVTAMSP